MLKKINDLLAGLPMTIVAGVFLLIDLVPHLAEEFGGTPMQLSVLPFDPAWVTVLICGVPLLYLAIWRSRHQQNLFRTPDLHRHVCLHRHRGSVCCR